MPTVITEPPRVPPPLDPPRKRWTRAEVQVLEAAGMLDTTHLELIEGELINKMGKRRPHGDSASLLHAWLIQVFGGRHVNSEMPIDVAPQDNPASQPEPDLIVVGRDYTAFRTKTPGPSDLILVIEISDTTLAFDMGVKAALYARAGIEDYWVLDIQGRRMFVHRDPQDGRYQSVVEYSENEMIAPLAAPDHEFRVGDAFPE